MIFMIIIMMMMRRRRTTYHILCSGAPSPPLAQPQLSSHPALFFPPLAPSENMAFRPESVEVSVGKPASDEGLVKNYMVLPNHASQTFIFLGGNGKVWQMQYLSTGMAWDSHDCHLDDRWYSWAKDPMSHKQT